MSVNIVQYTIFLKYIHRKEHSFMTFLKNAHGGCSFGFNW